MHLVEVLTPPILLAIRQAPLPLKHGLLPRHEHLLRGAPVCVSVRLPLREALLTAGELPLALRKLGLALLQAAALLGKRPCGVNNSTSCARVAAGGRRSQAEGPGLDIAQLVPFPRSEDRLGLRTKLAQIPEDGRHPLRRIHSLARRPDLETRLCHGHGARGHSGQGAAAAAGRPAGAHQPRDRMEGARLAPQPRRAAANTPPRGVLADDRRRRHTGAARMRRAGDGGGDGTRDRAGSRRCLPWPGTHLPLRRRRR
mmetsp:Transcript_6922/g.19482  ORF Transcript_6922/g.19482 Transcript_6922/m.19482 type:complete len:256 (-) Transcript_6922:728-1495(-)